MSNPASTTKIGKFITVLQSVESTNNYAMGMVHAGMAKQGDAWLAMEQTAGKGQRGKAWKTTTGENLLLSLIAEPAGLPVSAQFLFSSAVALGCYDFFNAYAGGETSVKWPNDLYWRDRKAGGILIENLIQSGTWTFSVVGIGININQVVFPPDLPNPVSLKQITGRTFDLTELSRQLCDAVDHRYRQLQQDGASTLATYNTVLYKKGQMARLKKDNAVFTTRIEAVDASGSLITHDAMERNFQWGQVEWML